MLFLKPMYSQSSVLNKRTQKMQNQREPKSAYKSEAGKE